MLRICQYIKNHRGQSMVEFALVFPLVLLLVIGLIAFGLVLKDYIAMAEAARVGARYAIVNPKASDSEIQEKVRDAAPGYDRLKVFGLPTPSPAQRLSGTPVTVTVTYYRTGLITSLPDPTDVNKTIDLIPTTKDGVLITGQAVMMME